MKKIVSLMVTVCMIASLIFILNVWAEPDTYPRMILDHDFNEGITVTNVHENAPTSRKYEITGESYRWYSDASWGSSGNLANQTYSWMENGDTVVSEPWHNSSGYIRAGSGKDAIPKMRMDMKNATTDEWEAATVDENTELMVMEIRIKRSGATDHSDFGIASSSGEYISTIFLHSSNGAPRFHGTGTGNGSLLSDTNNLEVPPAGGWGEWYYFKFMMDFKTKTYEAFCGTTLDTLYPIKLNGETTYNFYKTAANDLSSIVTGRSFKSGYSFDDVKIYAILKEAKPAATVSVTGKPNPNAELAAAYVYSEPSINEAEGESIGWWESSSTPDFENPVKLGSDIDIKTNANPTYIIQPTDSGKYIRFCAIPKSESGKIGAVAVSEPTAQIDTLTCSTSAIGGIDCTEFDFDAGNATYKGSMSYSNSGDTKDIVLLTAWYNNANPTPELVAVYMDAVTIPAGSENADTGISTGTYQNTNGKTAASADDLKGLTMKVLVWKDVTGCSPLSDTYTITGVKEAN